MAEVFNRPTNCVAGLIARRPSIKEAVCSNKCIVVGSGTGLALVAMFMIFQP